MAFDMGDFDFNYDTLESSFVVSPKAPLTAFPVSSAAPAKEDVVVKQEPMDFAFDLPPLTGSAASSSQMPADPNRFNGWTPEQVNALSQLITHLAQYNQAAGAAPSGTIQPSDIFSSSMGTSALPSTSTSSLSVSPTAPMSIPSSSAAPPSAQPQLSASPEDDEPLKALDDAMPGHGLGNIDDAIDNLVPLSDIFSAGRGKGGKKGGGVSSVVRGDEEDLDDDDSWRPSAEEYKKLSSKEKRQLRNKLSARAFRNRRKDYIGMLEGHIKDRDTIIDTIRTQLISSKSETEDLRRELDELKRNTMQVLHPESTKPSPSPMLGAFATTSGFANSPAGPSSLKRPGSPIQINKRKDLPSSTAIYGSDHRGFWGGNDLGGGSTICHTLFTPEIVLPGSAPASTQPRPFDLPRQNLNPRLNETPSLPAKDRSDFTSPFSDWAESTPFSLRSMDAYRMQMWSRLAREAQAEKAGTAPELRPKFYVEAKSAPTQGLSVGAQAQLATTASAHITSKLASSFWSAFQGPSAKLDTDKLSAVVLGQSRLKVVPSPARSGTPVAAAAGATKREEVDEKRPVAAAGEEDGLAALLGGLKLVAGPGKEGVRLGLGAGVGVGARADPLGTLGSWLGATSQARA